MEIREYDERFAALTHETDIALLRRAIAVSREARAAGNHPFGALLADAEGNILM